MTRHRFYLSDIKTVRTRLYAVEDLAEEIHKKEKELIEKLYIIDQKRYYVLYGFKSLRGYCEKALRLTRTQAQRIVTKVRRYEPRVNIGKEDTPTVRRATARTKQSRFNMKLDI